MVCFPLPDTIKDTRIFFSQKNKVQKSRRCHDNEVNFSEKFKRIKKNQTFLSSGAENKMS